MKKLLWFLIAISLCLSVFAIDMEDGAGNDGTIPWQIMNPAYPENDAWDVLSFEWDYFMIHNDDGSYSGSLGYLVANPREKDFLGNIIKIVPGGGNIAIAGKFDNTGLVSNYQNFDPDKNLLTCYEANYDNGSECHIDLINEYLFNAGFEVTLDRPYYSSLERFLFVYDNTTGYIGLELPDNDTNKLRLLGKTKDFKWDVVVNQEWKVLSNKSDLPSGEGTFRKETDDNIDNKILVYPAKQQWNVFMLWPRTRIIGTIDRLDENGIIYETIAVNAHGYRENSWGRWAFNQGGWDFATVSDDAKKVMMGWQTYHYKSYKLDFLDLGFIDPSKDEYQLVHFDNVDANGNFVAANAELGWHHDDWKWDKRSWQCVPTTTDVVADNGEYRIEARVTIGEDQIAMLSDATIVVAKYFIQIHIPWVSGKIIRVSDNSVITTFEGRGGGEFSNMKAIARLWAASEKECKSWGKKFAMPIPSK